MERVLSGMQPTGQLHVGHYLGVLTNFAKLQNDYDCFYMIANWHSLTAFYSNYSDAHKTIGPIVSDWLAAGIDPEKSTIFVQSQIKEHSELALILSMYTPVSYLMRNPTYKEKQENIDKDINSHGFLGYPVLQAADILLYDATRVPIGEDQLAHLELTREITRRFNKFNAKGKYKILKEPKPILSNFSKVLGTDGRKMSKSYNNTIQLSDSVEAIKKKISRMKTDTSRIKLTDPGNPSNCPVFTYYDFFAPEIKNKINEDCQSATIGCKDCKALVSEAINKKLEPFRENRSLLEDNKKIQDILESGREKASKVANETLTRVKDAMGLNQNIFL